LILELAVRGLLVPQDPNDEPASVLLEKIAAEKELLIKDKKIKKQKPLPPITDEEKPFELPKGWEWAYLSSLATFENGDRSSRYPNKSDLVMSGIPFFGAPDIKNEKLSYSTDLRFISHKKFSELSNGKLVDRDFVMLLRGTVGKVAQFHSNENHITGFINAQMLIIRLVIPEIDSYLKRFFISALFRRDIDAKISGAVIKQIPASVIAEIKLPIPPKEEQVVIAKKVDELMALCDQLEEQTENSLASHQTLVENLLDALTQAPDNTAFTSAWERIAQHFDILFTTEHSIDLLKQTILQLAVMGKLVPQDPNDEPASVLLEKIAAEKEQLIKDKKIKKQKPLPPIAEDEKPFELPNGWEWCRLDDLALRSEAGWSPNCNGHPRESNKWGVLKVSAVSWGEYRHQENKELPSNLEPRDQYEVMEGDFLISRANTEELVARAVVVPVNSPNKLMMSDKIIRFIFSKSVESEYVNLVNNSQLSRSYYAEVAGGTSSSMKNVTREHIRNLTIALPPRAEAKRIYSQYSSMLSVCDTLKTRIRESQTTQLYLADAMVEQAINEQT